MATNSDGCEAHPTIVLIRTQKVTVILKPTPTLISARAPSRALALRRLRHPMDVPGLQVARALIYLSQRSPCSGSRHGR